MISRRVLVWLVLFALGVAPIAALALRAQSEPKPSVSVPAEIDGYRAWRKALKEPGMMFPAAAMRCVGPTPEEQRLMATDPHLGYFVQVYVNKTAEHAFFDEKTPQYPVGSVLVKAKLPEAKEPTDAASRGNAIAPNGAATPKPYGDQPVLLTVMVKHPAGYAPATGDWEFMTTEGNGNLQARGHLASCAECHNESLKHSDYVYGLHLADGTYVGVQHFEER